DPEARECGGERLVLLAELLDRELVAADEAELAGVDAGRSLDAGSDRAPQVGERAERAAAQQATHAIVELEPRGRAELLAPLREHLALIDRRRSERLDADERQPAHVDIALPARDLREPLVELGALRVLLDRHAEAVRRRGEHRRARVRVEQLGELADDVEVQRVMAARAVEREAGRDAVALLVPEHE